jgi:hypothetical protein
MAGELITVKQYSLNLYACHHSSLTFFSMVFQIIGRFSDEDLMAQLLSFVPSLLDLTGKHSPSVRMVCLISLP